MTALGVQVVGTVLNKTVSTGDNHWGLPWADLLLVSRDRRYQIWIYLLFCTGWDNPKRFVARAGHSM